MDSSITKLGEAFAIICDLDDTHGGHQPAFKISEHFKNVNSNLSEGWSNVGKVCKEITSITSEILRVVHKDVSSYVSAVQLGEVDLMKAIEAANNYSQEIMKALQSLK